MVSPAPRCLCLRWLFIRRPFLGGLRRWFSIKICNGDLPFLLDLLISALKYKFKWVIGRLDPYINKIFSLPNYFLPIPPLVIELSRYFRESPWMRIFWRNSGFMRIYFRNLGLFLYLGFFLSPTSEFMGDRIFRNKDTSRGLSVIMKESHFVITVIIWK